MEGAPDNGSDAGLAPALLLRLRGNPGRPGLSAIQGELAKLTLIREINLPAPLFDKVLPHELDRYRLRVLVEAPYELRRHPEAARLTCRYLNSEDLRREINDGLNGVEQWDGANDFVFFARRGEMASNHREDHEVSMLSLHLLQNCMVYVNTLMIQHILAQPHWAGKLTIRDLAALRPLIWEHVNPYGRFELDMETSLPID